ncbi:hypothetical protein [Gordonia westfalica]|uniref:Uncharacterized protein n=1 Tax=Gordonia westfalica TaxID=158898 RepID=A0A1H2DM06_9ACTN|nr:hypothetical protein [Gordonia westfalica]SDT83711.1 hypothetical protein SAMN04488548_10131 [Gordonia westfalica]SDT83723.1 hypothetical protein SAMN04488548_10143 [Gordonia westfalica]SDT83858.1 hypothetical protein SAMN04488548_1056 [Gordonia westfalica]SDT83940.1 hypothetical protein SAMN04488548_10533 [Gordonia westfalica]SDT83962.1 hypothetical protein SAMN04488548_10541 [Gordonia westfalica]
MSVVDMQAFRTARDIVEVEADLASEAFTHGFMSSMQVSAAGCSAVLTDFYGRRVLKVEPQSSPWITRDHVLVFLAAQEAQP